MVKKNRQSNKNAYRSNRFPAFFGSFAQRMVMRLIYLCILLSLLTISPAGAQINFNHHWGFMRGDTSLSGNTPWEEVSLPHTPRIEPVVKTEQQWQGICYYRKFFTVPSGGSRKHIALQFDGAMHQADVYLNGEHIFTHLGGFLPFYINISKQIKWGRENILLLKLDNRDNAAIPPGKPIKDLDFNYYGGIYRDVRLIIKEPLYITDAVQANHVAGGGILVHEEGVGPTRATLVVKTELGNDYDEQQKALVKVTLTDARGRPVAVSASGTIPVGAHSFDTSVQTLTVFKPFLWSPAHPYLYRLHVQVLRGGKVIDEQWLKTGIRTFAFKPGGFFLNGQKLNIVGTNRHQEYPYIGYALSDNAQYRDAWKIKSAGLNFVRCSHYPPSPAFLDACDELGILVMDAIPGWQFFGDSVFQENSFQNIRDMIRRDRNHASVVLWEASLNESEMSKAYMTEAGRIVHQELPYADVYSSGWIDYAYDVSNPARQHAKGPDYWKKYDKPKPLLLAEYGDWEYYAQDAGFNQEAYAGLRPEQRNSRQFRGDGQERLLQQALNFQEAHNDNLNGPSVGDLTWAMFDYKRGYAQDIQGSGMMDIFRLPKFTYYFFQSQYGPVPDGAGFGKPMVFIANYWNNPSDSVVRIYSNCGQVELLLNGRSLGIHRPDSDRFSDRLVHPPFTWHIPAYVPGTLVAVGYTGGRQAAVDRRRTPGPPAKIVLKLDTANKRLQAGCNDAAFLYGYITDKDGTPIPGATDTVHFIVTGNGQIIGPSSVSAEAGIAAVLVKASDGKGNMVISASAAQIKSGILTIELEK